MGLKLLLGATVVAIHLVGAAAFAQESNSDDHAMAHTPGMTHDMASQMGSLPTEPGQGAFAAISEIVEMLTADPNTDWSVVNIDALRDHLVDMDMLISHADVNTATVAHGVEMRIALGGDGGSAASRMVPAHGPVLAGETGWNSDVQVLETEIVWRVTSERFAQQIQALGFFGLMTIGDHHTEHHIGIASGQMVH